MNKHLRAHVGRRREAIDRLQTLTRGVVVAGAAGTVGFGLLAAATFTGKASAQPATTEDQPATIEDQPVDQFQAPRTGASDPKIAPAPTPRPTRTRQPHAATGGSG
jgi:hypothetical protein